MNASDNIHLNLIGASGVRYGHGYKVLTTGDHA